MSHSVMDQSILKVFTDYFRTLFPNYDFVLASTSHTLFFPAKMSHCVYLKLLGPQVHWAQLTCRLRAVVRFNHRKSVCYYRETKGQWICIHAQPDLWLQGIKPASVGGFISSPDIRDGCSLVKQSGSDNTEIHVFSKKATLEHYPHVKEKPSERTVLCN